MKGSKLMLHKFGIKYNYIILAAEKSITVQECNARGDDSSNAVRFKIYTFIRTS